MVEWDQNATPPRCPVRTRRLPRQARRVCLLGSLGVSFHCVMPWRADVVCRRRGVLVASRAPVGGGVLVPQVEEQLVDACQGATVLFLGDGWALLHTHCGVSHVAASLPVTDPPGLAVTTSVKLLEVDGRRLVFEVSAHDGIDTISKGKHERFVIDAQKFNQKLVKKAG